MKRFYITDHALDRYIERVEAVSRDVAKSRITASAQAIQLAISIGCESVRLGNGARLVLDKHRIVSVYPKGGDFHTRRNRANAVQPRGES